MSGTNAKLSDITAASTLAGDELMYVVQGGNSRQVTVSEIGDANDSDLTPEMFGVIGDGASHASNSAFMIDWLQACDSQGRRGRTLGDSTYLVSDTVLVEISNSLDIYLSPGTIIKGEAGDGAVIHIRNATGTRPQFSLSGNCATIDNSLRTYNPGAASGTALELVRQGSINVSGITFQGAIGFGDSGIAAQECGRGVITGCTFYDQSDIGVYLTGGASTGDTDDWGDIKLIGNHFEGCEIAATARRQIGRTIMSNNTVKDCGAGFQSADATSGVTVIGFDRQIIISNNVGENLNGAWIDCRIGGPGSLICNNVVIDWGLTTATSAYGCIGGNGVLISGNSAIVRDLVPTTHAGFSLNDYTDAGGTTHQGTNCTVSNNLVVGANTGVRDLSGGANHFSFNRLLSCTTDYSVDETKVTHRNSTGLGIGTSAPQQPLHLDGKMRVSRVGVSAQYLELEGTAGFMDWKSFSATTAAKGVRWNVSTDASNTAPSSGNTDFVIETLGVEKFRAKDSGQVRLFPIGATPSRLEDGDMWYNGTTDVLHVRVNGVTRSINVT